jgi:hypothetical protein
LLSTNPEPLCEELLRMVGLTMIEIDHIPHCSNLVPHCIVAEVDTWKPFLVLLVEYEDHLFLLIRGVFDFVGWGRWKVEEAPGFSAYLYQMSSNEEKVEVDLGVEAVS